MLIMNAHHYAEGRLKIDINRSHISVQALYGGGGPVEASGGQLRSSQGEGDHDYHSVPPLPLCHHYIQIGRVR